MTDRPTTTTAPLKWMSAMKLLAVMRDDEALAETRLLLALGFFTGLRISDLLRLRWADVWRVDDFWVKEKKTGKYRQLTIHPRLKSIIEEIYNILLPLTLDSFLFKGKRGPHGEQPLTVTGANNRIKAAFEKFEIETQHPSSHTLRKTFAMRVYEAHNRSEEALILLSEMFNHANLKITRKYIGITEERIRDIYRSI